MRQSRYGAGVQSKPLAASHPLLLGLEYHPAVEA